MGQVRPRLADDERQTALAAGQRLRGEAAQPATAQAVTADNTARVGPVYALVTAPTPQQGLAQAQLAKTQILGRIDAALVPPHAELIAAKGQWRAALWPFASLADADRARVVLAGKGLKAQVVEF